MRVAACAGSEGEGGWKRVRETTSGFCPFANSRQGIAFDAFVHEKAERRTGPATDALEEIALAEAPCRSRHERVVVAPREVDELDEPWIDPSREKEFEGRETQEPREMLDAPLARPLAMDGP